MAQTFLGSRVCGLAGWYFGSPQNPSCESRSSTHTVDLGWACQHGSSGFCWADGWLQAEAIFLQPLVKPELFKGPGEEMRVSKSTQDLLRCRLGIDILSLQPHSADKSLSQTSPDSWRWGRFHP